MCTTAILAWICCTLSPFNNFNPTFMHYLLIHLNLSVIEFEFCQHWTNSQMLILLYLSYYCLPMFTFFFFTYSCFHKYKRNKFSPPTHFPSLYPNAPCMSPSPGNEPLSEKQVEKVSTLSLVKRDTALMLRDFRQGASNWIHSFLDHSRAPASPSTAAEAPPGATGIPPSVIV